MSDQSKTPIPFSYTGLFKHTPTTYSVTTVAAALGVQASQIKAFETGAHFDISPASYGKGTGKRYAYSEEDVWQLAIGVVLLRVGFQSEVIALCMDAWRGRRSSSDITTYCKQAQRLTANWLRELAVGVEREIKDEVKA